MLLFIVVRVWEHKAEWQKPHRSLLRLIGVLAATVILTAGVLNGFRQYWPDGVSEQDWPVWTQEVAIWREDPPMPSKSNPAPGG